MYNITDAEAYWQHPVAQEIVKLREELKKQHNMVLNE